MADKRVDRGIYKTPYGYRVRIRIHKRLHTKRFPPTHTLDALRRWRDDHTRAHRKKKTARGTLAKDAEAYLAAVKGMPTFADRKHALDQWTNRYGDEPRWMLTPEVIRTQLAAWKASGLANNTVNHRRTALSHLFTVLDGKNEYNPVREIPPYPLPPPIRRGLPMRIVVKVLKKIQGPKTRARLEVLAWTGLRPSELMRLTPGLVDTKRGVALVPTAKGGPPREIAFRLAVPAWKKLLKADALGKFSPQSARKQLHRACKAAKVPPFRVYDLRHSFLSALRQHGADLSDVQAQAGHSDIALTRRYAPTITAKLRKAVRQLG